KIGNLVAEYLGLRSQPMPCLEIRHPAHRNQSIGSVCLNNVVLHDEGRDIPQEYIQYAIARLRAKLRRDMASGGKDLVRGGYRGKTLLVVSEWLKTADRVLACLGHIREEGPARIVIATAVVSPQAIFPLRELADELIYLVEDDEVSLPQYYFGPAQDDPPVASGRGPGSQVLNYAYIHPMTILVPTDFSPLSRIAVFYAAELARPLNANLVIAAVVNVNPSTETLLRSKRLEQELLASVQQEADTLLAAIREKAAEPIDVSFETATGFPLDEQVELLVKRVNADLIVMGSRGASGLRRLLIGSNAVTVMNNSSVPVMIIPEGVTYKKPEHIVYATDLFSYRDETRTVVAFARLLDAHVHLLHVLPLHRKDDRDTKAIEADLKKLTEYNKISFEVTHHDDVATGVDQYVTQNGADILAMFTHHLDFYEKLLGRS